jgi:hypothetical protein
MPMAVSADDVYQAIDQPMPWPNAIATRTDKIQRMQPLSESEGCIFLAQDQNDKLHFCWSMLFLSFLKTKN